jgi:hypothetical protein
MEAKMENQKWFERGCEGTNAFAEMMNFEKNFKPELEAKIREHADIDEKISKLGAKLNSEQVAYDKAKSVFFGGLRESETRTRSDAQKELVTLTAKGKRVTDDDIEEAVLEKLIPKAKGITALRKSALFILELERDLARARMELAMIEESVFQRRREAARNFCTVLFQTAGLSVQWMEFNSSLDHARRWSAELSRLNEALAIAAGQLRHFQTVGLSSPDADGLLEFACYVPPDKLPKILEGWSAVKLAKGKNPGISLSQNGKVSWRFLKNREPDKSVGVSSSDFSGGVAHGR